jgi:glycerol-3-phosphate O-acyltransferase
LYKTYKDALAKALEEPVADREAAEMVASLSERVVMEAKQPFTFPSAHKRIVEPFDYYDFGQRFIGNLINFDKSFVGHAERILDMQQALARGENVLLFSNHQTEADPEVWAWMTEALAPAMAEETFYIAGDRVVTDVLAKPFSMGRNLVCVHSKKHMDDDPDTKAAKMATNARSVRELGKLFKGGGVIVWVAPSGGRDRKGTSGEYEVSKFDPSAVMLLYRMLASAKRPGHVYPMAMASAEILPPPAAVEKTLGEERVMDFRGVGISVGDELDTTAILDGIEDKGEQAQALAVAAYEKVTKVYKPLADVIYDGAKAGKDFSQPWKA